MFAVDEIIARSAEAPKIVDVLLHTPPEICLDRLRRKRRISSACMSLHQLAELNDIHRKEGLRYIYIYNVYYYRH
jgi:predicted kinase